MYLINEQMRSPILYKLIRQIGQSMVSEIRVVSRNIEESSFILISKNLLPYHRGLSDSSRPSDPDKLRLPGNILIKIPMKPRGSFPQHLHHIFIKLCVNHNNMNLYNFRANIAIFPH